MAQDAGPAHWFSYFFLSDMSAKWHKVANVADLSAGNALQVSVGNELIAVYNLDGKFYATSDICTHQQANLSEGFIDGENIECALHQALFHIPTGKVLREPAVVDLKTYPVKQEDGFIYIEL